MTRKKEKKKETNLRERAIVPDVSMVGEAVPHVAEASTFDILFDRVKGLLFGDLHLGVRPSRDFDDDIQDALVLVCKERDVVECRYNRSILLDENAVLCHRSIRSVSGYLAMAASRKAHTKSVGSTDETWSVFYDQH